jgi:uncharacterized RDD family membrane protein YckC
LAALFVGATVNPTGMEPLDTDVAIEAPEHIVFSYRAAGPARRAAAYLLDLVICYGALFIFALILLFALGGAAAISGAGDGLTGVGMGVILLAVFAVQWVYFVVWEGLTGRTPGKSALRLRVVTTTGRPIHFTEAALRNVLRAADAMPNAYVAGLVCMALTRRFQRLGDLVAGTMVILEEKARAAVALRLWPRASEAELLAVPEHVALDADERAALELFLRRRSTLGGPREWELASTVAPAFEERFGFRASDPVRTLALLYDAAVNAGRSEAPPSSRVPDSYRSPGDPAPPSGPARPEGRR